MTIYLTNAGAVQAVARDRASERSRASVGAGLVYSIMRKPRPEYGEAGSGRVLALTPPLALLEAARADRSAEAWAAYEAGLLARWDTPERRPGFAPDALKVYASVGFSMRGVPWDGDRWAYVRHVEDGATLICACSVAQADAGRCHRVIAARILAAAGWRVVLDGREVRTHTAHCEARLKWGDGECECGRDVVSAGDAEVDR